jgi:hypothetical protein
VSEQAETALELFLVHLGEGVEVVLDEPVQGRLAWLARLVDPGPGRIHTRDAASGSVPAR